MLRTEVSNPNMKTEGMIMHPEGGSFREVYRINLVVT